MKSNHWLLLFITDAVLHLVTTVYSFPTLNLLTKPLLMILLGGYFISLVGSNLTKLSILVILALVGSWFGDTFLMLQGSNPLFFIFGLGSFLLAHIAYILAFKKFDTVLTSSGRLVTSILFISYSLVLSYVLWSGLGEMKIPVILYALVLTLMGIFGVIKNMGVSNFVVIGAVLFILSDSMIAYDKFVEPFSSSRFLIMCTYISAQFLIIRGISLRMPKES